MLKAFFNSCTHLNNKLRYSSFVNSYSLLVYYCKIANVK